MPVNADKPHLWKSDIAQSVDFYNNWFMQFAPQAYRDTRLVTTQQVVNSLTPVPKIPQFNSLASNGYQGFSI